MKNETKLALFIGGAANNQTKEIKEIELRLNWFDSIYIWVETLNTKKLGEVEIYVPDNMKGEEIARRVKIIKSS